MASACVCVLRGLPYRVIYIRVTPRMSTELDIIYYRSIPVLYACQQIVSSSTLIKIDPSLLLDFKKKIIIINVSIERICIIAIVRKLEWLRNFLKQFVRVL